MISSDGVTKVTQTVSIFNTVDRGDVQLAVEEGRIVNISRFFLPFILDALLDLKVVPSFSSLSNSGVVFSEHFRGNDLSSNSFNFFSGGPDISQEDIVSILVLTQGLSVKIEIDVTSKSVGNDQRRRSQIVSSGLGVNSTFEVSVTRKDSSSNKIVILNNLVEDGVDEITRVTDTGHAAITGMGETQSVHILSNTCLFVVLSDDLRTRRERSLDVSRYLKTLQNGILGKETSSKHDTRVGGVGTRGDSSN